jgi:hypothetical protein
MIHTLIDAMQESVTGPMEAPFQEQSLVDENAFLRSIIVELLIKNQKLRCAMQTYSCPSAGY